MRTVFCLACFNRETRKMFLPIILVFIASIAFQDVVTTELCSTCVKLEGTCYNISYVLTLNATFRNQVVIPKMAILHYDNILFYSFEPVVKDPEYYKVAFVYLDDPKNEGILADDHIKVLNFGTFDIDQDNKHVYLGGSDGIFKYDKEKLTPYSSRGDTIKSLFYKSNVYFVDYDGKTIKVKKNDEFHDVLILEDNKIKMFVITKYDVIVYLSDKGLFLKKKDETVLLSYYPFYRGMTMDLDGGIYVWWLDEIYKVGIEANVTESRLVNVGRIREPIGAMTFDNKNNILFNVGRDLYRMTKTNMTKC